MFGGLLDVRRAPAAGEAPREEGDREHGHDQQIPAVGDDVVSAELGAAGPRQRRDRGQVEDQPQRTAYQNQIGSATTISRMISPVRGQRAQYRSSVANTNASPAINVSAGMRSGRCNSGAVRRSTVTLTGPVRYEMMVATEITSASVAQPRKKNMKMKATTRFSHIAGRGMPQRGCTLPRIFGSVPLRCIP